MSQKPLLAEVNKQREQLDELLKKINNDERFAELKCFFRINELKDVKDLKESMEKMEKNYQKKYKSIRSVGISVYVPEDGSLAEEIFRSPNFEKNPKFHVLCLTGLPSSEILERLIEYVNLKKNQFFIGEENSSFSDIIDGKEFESMVEHIMTDLCAIATELSICFDLNATNYYVEKSLEKTKKLSVFPNYFIFLDSNTPQPKRNHDIVTKNMNKQLYKNKKCSQFPKSWVCQHYTSKEKDQYIFSKLGEKDIENHVEVCHYVKRKQQSCKIAEKQFKIKKIL